MNQLLLGIVSGFVFAALVVGAIFLMATYGPPPPKPQPMFVAGIFLGATLFVVAFIGLAEATIG